MADNQLDLLIFGATGVTGFHCISYLHKFSKERNLTWGISGRSETKLREALKKAGAQIGEDLSKTTIIVADIKDQNSLNEMARKTKVVLNCCGPYVLMGYPVIEACIKAGTHHVDVSGEPGYMEELPEKYNAAAKDKGIYIVSACGLDCLPTDLGLIHLQQKFDGVLNSVVGYIQIKYNDTRGGSSMGYGTWQSLVNELSRIGISGIKKKMFPPTNTDFKPILQVKTFMNHSDVTNGWVMPFVGHDKAVMQETQKYLYEHEKQRPVQVEVLLSIPSLFKILLLQFAIMVLFILAQFSFTRNWLIEYPHIFTAGRVSKEEHPSEEGKEGFNYRLTLYGEGWKGKTVDTTPPNKTITAQLNLKNAYTFTVVGLIGAGIVILTEKEKLPKNGGVYSPGAAFGKTSVMKMLLDNGTTFEIKNEKEKLS